MRRRLNEIEWDAIAGVLAALLALILHLLDVADVELLVTVLLLLVALLLVRDLRREAADDRVEELLAALVAQSGRIRALLATPEVTLVGPRRLRAETERFAREARGDMTWFNVCLEMFLTQGVFDAMLRPAIENPEVRSIQFVIDRRERAHWDELLAPKIARLPEGRKVHEPAWCLMDETVSFILSENAEDAPEALLSFWGEPFMSGATGRDIPRYIFRVDESSELIARFVDLERAYRMRVLPEAPDPDEPRSGGQLSGS